MTCKDCIHERVCLALIKDGLPYLDESLPAEAFCMTFKNKLDVHKTVYGKWIFKKYVGEDYYKCSCCDQEYPFPPAWDAYDIKEYFKYCSNCGARMIEED